MAHTHIPKTKFHRFLHLAVVFGMMPLSNVLRGATWQKIRVAMAGGHRFSQALGSFGKTTVLGLGCVNLFVVFPTLSWANYVAVLGVQSVFREKDFNSWLGYVATVNWKVVEWAAQHVYGVTVWPLRQRMFYVLWYVGVPWELEDYKATSLSEEITRVSHVFLFGQKEEELQSAKKSVEELTEEIKAERKNTQDLEAKYVKELQDEKDKYEERIRELESELAAIDQVSQKVIHEFKHFLRAICLVGVGVLVIGLCMRSAYQFRQSRVRAKFRECRRNNKQLANDNKRQKEQISSQQFQIQICNSTIVDTKNKLKDSQLALRRSEEDKAQLTKDHFQLKETNTRLKESHAELKESNTRLEESNFQLKEANTRLEESNFQLKEAIILKLKKANSTIASIASIVTGSGLIIAQLIIAQLSLDLLIAFLLALPALLL